MLMAMHLTTVRCGNFSTCLYTSVQLLFNEAKFMVQVDSNRGAAADAAAWHACGAGSNSAEGMGGPNRLLLAQCFHQGDP